MIRILRMSRFYEIHKYFKLVINLKRSKQKKYLEIFLSLFYLKLEIRTIFKIFFPYFLFIHIFCCSWYYAAKSDNFNDDTWVYKIINFLNIKDFKS